jgi:TolA-binding protein
MTEEKDWGALAEKHLASIKRDMKISLEDATVRAAHKVMTEFNNTERESKVKQELVKQQLDRLEADIAQLRVKTQELRNDVIEEVAQHIEKLTGFGQDTVSSFAIYIRRMKK